MDKSLFTELRAEAILFWMRSFDADLEETPEPDELEAIGTRLDLYVAMAVLRFITGLTAADVVAASPKFVSVESFYMQRSRFKSRASGTELRLYRQIEAGVMASLSNDRRRVLVR